MSLRYWANIVRDVGRGRGPCPRLGFWVKGDTYLWGEQEGKQNDALSAKINKYLRQAKI